MYCSMCGCKTNNQSICDHCNGNLAQIKTQKNIVPFLIVLFMIVFTQSIMNIISCIMLKVNLSDSMFSSNFLEEILSDNLRATFVRIIVLVILSVITLILLKKVFKADLSCIRVKDIWIFCIIYLSYLLPTIIGMYGTDFLFHNYGQHVYFVFWGNIRYLCTFFYNDILFLNFLIILFVLIRNHKINKKKALFILCVSVCISTILLLLSKGIVYGFREIFSIDPEDYALTVTIFRTMNLFLWFRIFVLFLFFYIWGKKEQGYIFCIFGLILAVIIEAIIYLFGGYYLLGFAKTIFYAIWGVFLLIGVFMNKRKCS